MRWRLTDEVAGGGVSVADEGGTDLQASGSTASSSLLFAAGTPLSLKRMATCCVYREGAEGGGRAVDDVVQPPRPRHHPAGRSGRLPVQRAGERRWVRALLRERPARLGRAALETLSVVAYKQPATRAEIEAVRGVDCDSAITTLLARRLIKIAGRKEAIGRPLMYATTPEFLEVFGLNDLGQLPALKEIGPVQEPEDETGIDDGDEWRAAAEDPQPGGGELAASGGGVDPLGAVTVNGRTTTELGTRANPWTDRIAVDGKPLRPRRRISICC
jgi:segregation and condensation protein B